VTYLRPSVKLDGGRVILVTPFSKQARVPPDKAPFQRGVILIPYSEREMIFVDHPTASHSAGIQCPIYIRH
jgi:hypothetical protein